MNERPASSSVRRRCHVELRGGGRVDDDGDASKQADRGGATRDQLRMRMTRSCTAAGGQRQADRRDEDGGVGGWMVVGRTSHAGWIFLFFFPGRCLGGARLYTDRFKLRYSLVCLSVCRGDVVYTDWTRTRWTPLT